MSQYHDVVIIQSKDRSLALGAYPSSNFKVALPVKYNKVVQLQLLSVELPYTFYNITGLNKKGITFVGSVLGTTTAFDFTLADGNYSVDDFCDTLLAFLQQFTYSKNGVTTPYVTSVDYTSSNVIYINSLFPLYSYNTPYGGTFGNLASIVGLNTALTGLPGSAYNPANPNMALVNANNNSNSDGSYTHMFTSPCNFNINNEVILKIGNVAANVYTSSKSQGTFRIQVNTSYGNNILLNVSSNVGNIINMNNITLEYLDVSLLSCDGTLISLNNCEFQFSLGITYIQ